MSDLVTPEVPISKIDVDSDSNVRSHMDEEKLAGLTASVEAVGVMQPVTVRPKAGGRFERMGSHERRFCRREAEGR
jgi:ParB family chromosome partitioning protein